MTGGIIIDNFFKGVRLNILKEQLVNLKQQYRFLCYAINTAQKNTFAEKIKAPADTRYYGGHDIPWVDRLALIKAKTKKQKEQIFDTYMTDIGTPDKEKCDNI